MTRVKSFLVLLVVFAVLILSSELLLRSLELVPKVESGWGWSGSPRRAAQPPSAINQINQLGLRGRRFEYKKSDFVILLVGDSQVEAANIPFNLMPERILENQLGHYRNVKVFSIGSSGWGQDQQLIALKSYFDNHRADLVLLWPTPMNDFWENTFVDRNTVLEAGPLKPTFFLINDYLHGPFYAKPFYIYNSAIAQLFLSVFNGIALNDFVLNKWMREMPAQNLQPVNSCASNVEIDQMHYFEDIFILDPAKRYTIVTSEDVQRGRSHFSPFLYPRTSLEDYQISLTRHLYRAIYDLVSKNGASFYAFYPVREDFDSKLKNVTCVKHNNEYYSYKPEFIELLSSVVPINKLILANIYGSDEVSIAPSDRHLSPTGHEKLFKALSRKIESLIDSKNVIN